MTNTDLLRAMGRIDPKLVADAAPDAAGRKSVNRARLKWGAVAACLCLIAAGVYRIAAGFVPAQTADPGISIMSDSDPRIGFWVALRAGENTAEGDAPYTAEVSFGTLSRNVERFVITTVCEDFEITKSCGDEYIVDGEQYSAGDFYVTLTNEVSALELPQKFTLTLTKKTDKEIYSGRVDITVDEYLTSNSGWARKSVTLFYYGDGHVIYFSAVSPQEAEASFRYSF